MTLKKHYFLFFVIVLLCSSCSHYYYAPDEANMLKLNEQHDLKISVSGNSTNGNYELKHTNLQLGYSPIKHVGVFASHFKMSGNEPIQDPIRGGKGHLNSAGLGGYYFLESESILNKLVKYDDKIGVRSGFLFDAYAGYGKGHIYNFYIEGGHSDLDLQKYFVQGGVHWQGKALGLSYTMKFGRLNYFNGLIIGQLDESEINSLLNIEEIKEFPFRETSLKFYMGVKYARVYLNVATTVDEFDNSFTHRTSVGSFGIIVEIDEIYKGIKGRNKSVKLED